MSWKKGKNTNLTVYLLCVMHYVEHLVTLFYHFISPTHENKEPFSREHDSHSSQWQQKVETAGAGQADITGHQCYVSIAESPPLSTQEGRQLLLVKLFGIQNYLKSMIGVIYKGYSESSPLSLFAIWIGIFRKLR